VPDRPVGRQELEVETLRAVLDLARAGTAAVLRAHLPQEGVSPAAAVLELAKQVGRIADALADPV